MTQKYTAIVTGASSGIGRAISGKLGVLGYEVFGIGRRFVRKRIETLPEYLSVKMI